MPADARRPPASLLEPTLRTDSEYERSLMQFFALHRIATPYMVMDAFPRFFSYHKKTMRHLNWLANKGYLGRHDYRDRGYVYNITNAGYERCRDADIGVDLARIPYMYREPNGKQVEHELLITKSAVSLYGCVRNEPNLHLLGEGRFGVQNIVVYDPDTGEELRPFDDLIPDYFYLSRDRNGLMFRMWEVMRGVESIDNVRRMMQEHQRWGFSRAAEIFLTGLYRKWGAKEPKPEYQTHCILESSSWKHTDAWKERMTMMQTFHVTPRMQGRVWTTTKEELDKALAEGLSINYKIWHRGKDLLDKRGRWENARDGTRTRLIDGYMRSLPTHSLFA